MILLNFTWHVARAYYLSSSHDVDNLDRAEAALNELIDTIEADADGVKAVFDVVLHHTHTLRQENPEHQQLRWMRVAILKRRKAAEVELLDGEGVLRLPVSSYIG